MGVLARLRRGFHHNGRNVRNFIKVQLFTLNVNLSKRKISKYYVEKLPLEGVSIGEYTSTYVGRESVISGRKKLRIPKMHRHYDCFVVRGRARTGIV